MQQTLYLNLIHLIGAYDRSVQQSSFLLDVSVESDPGEPYYLLIHSLQVSEYHQYGYVPELLKKMSAYVIFVKNSVFLQIRESHHLERLC